MSREILFRGKRVDNGEWVEGMLAYFFDNPKNTIIMPSCFFATRDMGGEDEKGNQILEEEMAVGGFINVIPETVGQFTGLLDKKGNKIFEGDVLKYQSTHPKHNGKYFNNAVEFASGQSLVGWRMRNGRCVVKATPFKFYVSEIIGNIHDNPELLGKEQSCH